MTPISYMEIYLDHAATARIVPEALGAMVVFEEVGRGNPFRGVHAAAERATVAYEDARKTVADFFGASIERTIFTKGTTEGLNIVASGFARHLQSGDEIVLSLLEHHAQSLPWRAVAENKGCTIRFIPLTEDGRVDVETAKKVITSQTKIVAITHVSNILGSIVPIKEIAEIAHGVGAYVCVDGAQAAGHISVNVQDLGVDAYAVSAHKMYGPMGIGALFLSPQLQVQLQPLLLGGGMIEEILADGCPVFAEGTRRFEAGTPNVTGAVGFAAVCNVLLGKQEEILRHEQELTAVLWNGLHDIEHVTLYGPLPGDTRTGVISFSVKGMHPHDVAQALADQDIAVRAGFHCAATLARCLHPDGVVRVSIGKDTTREECEVFLRVMRDRACHSEGGSKPIEESSRVRNPS